MKYKTNFSPDYPQTNEVIVIIKDNPKFRVVCRFNQQFPWNVWHYYLETKIERKQYFLFGKTVEFWRKVDRHWNGNQYNSISELEEYANRYYKKDVVDPLERVIRQSELKA